MVRLLQLVAGLPSDVALQIGIYRYPENFYYSRVSTYFVHLWQSVSLARRRTFESALSAESEEIIWKDEMVL